MGKKSNPAEDVTNQAKALQPAASQPSDQENTLNALGGDLSANYRNAVATSNQNYGNIMSGYKNMADTGGYSPQDIQELRARGTSPVRAAYGNTMMQLDRARALGGNGGSPNYIAAVSKAQRQLPQQMADAETGVNAQLADSVRQGKLAGLSGMNTAYGTTPGLSTSAGNQMLGSYGMAGNLAGQRQNYGLNLLGTQLGGYSANQGAQGSPWWQTALGVAGTVAPFFSDRTMKEDIRRIPSGSMREKLKDLPLYTWKYKGDKTSHLGPMAQEFKKMFGVGDGKTIHPADVMGVVLASAKEAYA